MSVRRNLELFLTLLPLPYAIHLHKFGIVEIVFFSIIMCEKNTLLLEAVFV